MKYQLYSYHESSAQPSTAWNKIGDDVAALRLPMTCILSRFLAGHCYYFAVCAIDDHSRVGPYSDPQSIFLDHNDDSLDLNNNSPAASPLNHAVNHHHNERS